MILMRIELYNNNLRKNIDNTKAIVININAQEQRQTGQKPPENTGKETE